MQHTYYDPRAVIEHAKRHSLTGIPARPSTSGFSATCDYQQGSQRYFAKRVSVKRVAQNCRYMRRLDTRLVNRLASNPAADADLQGKCLRGCFLLVKHGRPLSQRFGAHFVHPDRSPDVYLAAAAQRLTQPEIGFVDSIVNIHLASTFWFRADWSRFQSFVGFLKRDTTSRGATQPVYGLRDKA